MKIFGCPYLFVKPNWETFYSLDKERFSLYSSFYLLSAGNRLLHPEKFHSDVASRRFQLFCTHWEKITVCINILYCRSLLQRRLLFQRFWKWRKITHKNDPKIGCNLNWSDTDAPNKSPTLSVNRPSSGVSSLLVFVLLLLAKYFLKITNAYIYLHFFSHVTS